MDTPTLNSTELTSHTHGVSSSTRERALTLLGKGVSVDATAAACGVSASAISQLLSYEDFAAAVAERRFHALEKHNKQDSEYDDIESQLTEKFKQSIPLMMRPMEILKGLQVINAQKRRGMSAPESIHDKQTVVSITLPSVILNNFTNSTVTTNIHNQVVRVGDKDLTTMQSGTLLGIHKASLQVSAPALQPVLSEALTSQSPPAVQPNQVAYDDITTQKHLAAKYRPPALTKRRDPTDV